MPGYSSPGSTITFSQSNLRSATRQWQGTIRGTPARSTAGGADTRPGLNPSATAPAAWRCWRRCARLRFRASEQRFVPWPFVQHPHALADRQPNARPVLGRQLEDAPRLVETCAGDLCSTSRPCRSYGGRHTADRRFLRGTSRRSSMCPTIMKEMPAKSRSPNTAPNSDQTSQGRAMLNIVPV
jgi:hypothetical protein